MELPLDIMFDIFSRLPIEKVLESKLVSKNWRDVVLHPSFSQKHLNRLRSSEDSGNLGFLFTDYTNSDSKEFYYVEYDENNETPIISNRRINIPTELKSYTVVGSYNGLICIYELSSIIICNPITREYVYLPRLNCYFFLRCGFGYLVSTNEYKVVRVYELPGEPSSVQVEVYTLGSGNGWRNVGKLNSEYGLLCDQVGVFLNGALHWAVSGKRIIVAFDLADETFS
ncbi:F-box protein At3g07870-like [Papaver somniferum]|uniref:F-box protein At3g07870-like n=1 Tax=Papaver somniferum TaxID=3469 RepID=UPI000E703048|nr:F-box protein At3g07870-like [Papaver somniferum]